MTNAIAITWKHMNQAPRRPASDATALTVPCCAGVYAWYRDGRPVYVGMSQDLRERLVETHLSTAESMYFSAFRRNVAEHLGFGKPSDIKAKRRVLSAAELNAVEEWILGCELAWIECNDKSNAKDVERRLKSEYLPPLTKR